MMLVIAWKSRTFCWNLIGYFLLALRHRGRALGSYVRLNVSKKGNAVACFRTCFSFSIFFRPVCLMNVRKKMFSTLLDSHLVVWSLLMCILHAIIEPSCTRNLILSILLTANNFTISRFSILWQNGSGATIIFVSNITLLPFLGL